MTAQDDERLAAQAIEARAYEEAMRLLRPLAERGSEYALLTLGWILEKGAAGATDKEAARLHDERAAALVSAAAHLELGRLLSSEGEAERARAAFAAGAEAGDIPCMSRLGRMMVEGRGGPVDLAADIGWLERAAAQGHIFAQRMLLHIKAQDARSIFERISIRLRIFVLAVSGALAGRRTPGRIGCADFQ
jgi:TPR repeat protein